MTFSLLPHYQAICNIFATIFLFSGLYFIKKENKARHKHCMIIALIFSTLFLIMYLTYHYYEGTFKFNGIGAIRTVYFLILGTHTVLAAILPILVIKTLYHAIKKQDERHKKIARITFPIWIYVAVTGVIVHAFLYHIYI